jgi:hypothetical protein
MRGVSFVSATRGHPTATVQNAEKKNALQSQTGNETRFGRHWMIERKAPTFCFPCKDPGTTHGKGYKVL